jgi:transposase InsO family protein
VVAWYHRVLVHPGKDRMIKTIAMHFYHPGLRTRVVEFVKQCKTCQEMKITNQKYGELPPREPELVPWGTVAVDLIGPWTITLPGRDIIFNALTIIDTVTNYPEAIRIESKDARHVALQFRNTWLCRYPKPVACIYDQGGEFKGFGFQELLRQYSIKPRPITTKNPQSNGIIERLHQSMGNSVRTLLGEPCEAKTEAEANMLVDTALQLSAYSVRASIHSVLQETPGSIAFQRDMLLNIPVLSDFETLRNRKQAAINKQLLRANKSRTPHDYQPGDKIWVLAFAPNKLEPRAHGPYKIRYAHTNGTVTYYKNATTTERINIRRIKPFIAKSQNG